MPISIIQNLVKPKNQEKIINNEAVKFKYHL